MRILEREVPEGEHRPEHPAQHIGGLRHGNLAVGDGKLVLVRVILGEDRTDNNQTQEKCY